MNVSSLMNGVGSSCETETAELVGAAEVAPVKTAATIGAIALAHFTAQLAVAHFIMLKWVILFAVKAGFVFTLPGELTLSHTLAFRILAFLTEPVRSLPLPAWTWENRVTALLLAAVNSAIWGVCLGALVSGVGRGPWLPRSLAATLAWVFRLPTIPFARATRRVRRSAIISSPAERNNGRNGCVQRARISHYRSTEDGSMNESNWRRRSSSARAVLLLVSLANPLRAAEAEAKPVLEKLMKSPAVFVENRGQWADESVRFALISRGANVGLTDEGPRVQLFQPEDDSSESRQKVGHANPGDLNGPAVGDGAVGTSRSTRHNPKGTSAVPARMKEFSARFVGARRVTPMGEGKSEQVFHYRRGEPGRWRENVPAWDMVVYRGLYEGIDLRVTGRQAGVKYEFMVAPGADWRQIRVRYEGIERLVWREDGTLFLHLGEGWAALTDGAPLIYQEVGGRSKEVSGRFLLLADKTCAFDITGDYDPERPLVIDPEIEWSTYLGGSDGDSGQGLAVDSTGCIFVTGTTMSSGWVSGGFDETFDGTSDVFVAKLSPAGAHLWSTYLGGSDEDAGTGIAVDRMGNVFITGWTKSSGWVRGGFDTSWNGGSWLGDAFVVKLSAAGEHLWSTYLGGESGDAGNAIAVDSAGNVLVAGETSSDGWVRGGFDTSREGHAGFVAKLSPAGAHLWSTYLGNFLTFAYGIAADGAGNVLVCGATQPLSDWVSGGFDTSQHGNADAYVVKISPAGKHLWSTYLGGGGMDIANGIAVDSSGNVLVVGLTQSDGWVSGGFDTTFHGENTGYGDAFVVKLSTAGEHLWSTYLGGSEPDTGEGIAVDGSGNVLVTGATKSCDWVNGGFKTICEDRYDSKAFVAKLSSTGAHLWSTYLGGNNGDGGSGIAVDDPGHVVVAGWTDSSGWVGGGFDTSYHGGTDAFVARISDPLVTGDVGALQVLVDPPEACNAGARWRRIGAYMWHLSGDTETGIPVGTQIIEFKEVDFWDKPANLTVSIVKDDIARVSARYVRQAGSLQVTISPQEAIDTGAQWRRTGTTNWFNTGETENGVPAGVCAAEFKDLLGWIAPAPLSLTITNSQTTSASATYERSAVNLVWSTYVGGEEDDGINAIAVDRDGNVLVTGTTISSGWVSGGFDTNHHGNVDAFVMKISPAGKHLWSTYLGGDGEDGGSGIAVDGEVNVLVAGTTGSSGWVSGGYNTVFGGFYRDAFVAKLSANGAHLWSSYLGGPQDEFGSGIAVDGLGNVLVTGSTWSSNWVSGGFDTDYHGQGGDLPDGFVVKLSPAGAHLWSTYLGGGNADNGNGIAVDSKGNALVTGDTKSPGWTSGGFDTTYNPGPPAFADAFVAKLSPDGAQLWSTYFGGDIPDYGHSIAVDAVGNVLVTGTTWSAWGPLDWNEDAFALKTSPDGAYLWSTYLGGRDVEYGLGIAVDAVGNVLVTGSTWSSGWVERGFDGSYNGNEDAFVFKMSPDGARLWSSYIGGGDSDVGYGIAADRKGNIFVGGATRSSGWVAGGFDTNFHGGWSAGTDGFVTKISEGPGQSDIRVTTVAVDAGNGKLEFEAAGYAMAGLAVETTDSLANPIHWAVESNATITPIAPGRFAVQLPLRGGTCYCRIRASQ